MEKITDCAIFQYEDEDQFLIDKLYEIIRDFKSVISNFFHMNDYPKPVIHIIDQKSKIDDIFRKFHDMKETEEVPKWFVGLSASDMQIYYLSIRDYDNTSHAFPKEDYEMQLSMYQKTILHEYIHYVNRLFCNENHCSFSIPCLSEGVAQYLSHQKDDCVLSFTYSLDDLLKSNHCYNGWYLVTKYIIENYSQEFFLELLKDNDQADKFIRDSYNHIVNYYSKIN